MTINWAAIGLLALAMANSASAQGTDGTPAERDLMVLAEMLPGRWDNGEQVNFEPRLKVPPAERHRQHVVELTRGDTVLNRATMTLVDSGAPPVSAVLTPADATTVRMSIEGRCDVLWKREAGQFRGASDARCNGQKQTWLVAADHLWIGDNRYMRATGYSCYVDMPGASGGRAIPFKRIDNLTLYDRGEIVWFDSPETPSRRLGLQLRNVHWAMNNAPGVFARDSLTLYLVERREDGEPHSLLYAFTAKNAPRIGMNGIWALANCARETMQSARPEF